MTIAVWLGLLSAAAAQTLVVPNHSFESQSGVGQPFGVNILVDSWQKAQKPAYFEVIESQFGIFWVQTAGVFVDSNPYSNRDGTQAGYILSFPQVALFQDYDTQGWNDPVPSHAFNAVYEIGKSYHLTLGVFAKVLSTGGFTDGSMLQLSLYYRDGANFVNVGATTVTYQAVDFPLAPPLNFIDYQVNVPTVQAGDPWAGQPIGIKIESLLGDGSLNWDFDNVRLTAVPEPTGFSLLGLGVGGWAWVRRRARRS